METVTGWEQSIVRRYAPGMIRRSQLALVTVLVAGVFLSLIAPSSATAADAAYPSSSLVIQLRSVQDAAVLDSAHSVRALDSSGTVVVADFGTNAAAARA
ncbi:MAG: hypothetical protein IT333_05330, partial [Thermomicrobiales bacterium]|nr:hypothetical protein [Thermomicrobiales bacterium]